MQRRPWPIVLIAILQLLIPVGTVLLNAWLSHRPIGQVLKIIFYRASTWSLIDAFGLPAIAAASIYAMKSWSYPIFLAITAKSLISTFVQWEGYPGNSKYLYVTGFLLANAVFIYYFLMPSVRAIYFNPRLRWWESKPRFRVSIHGVLESGASKFGFEAFDISEGGMFLRLKNGYRLHEGELVQISFAVMELEIETQARVAHVRGENSGYGIEFVELSAEAARNISRVVKASSLLSGSPSAWVAAASDFRHWLKTLLKTGKGALPEVPARERRSSSDDKAA